MEGGILLVNESFVQNIGDSSSTIAYAQCTLCDSDSNYFERWCCFDAPLYFCIPIWSFTSRVGASHIFSYRLL